ncbi:MAG: LysE family transporter [Solitalea-like symbiont of Acarus siro]
MIELIFTAIGVGLVLSLLAGPGFFALITTNIRYGFKAGVYFASGIFIGDTIYIIITIYSIYLIKSIQHLYHNLFSLVGGGFLLVIGLALLT